VTQQTYDRFHISALNTLFTHKLSYVKLMHHAVMK